MQIIAKTRSTVQRYCSNSANLKQVTGFTLIELIMVMVIVGILSAVALPKFSDNSIFQSRGFADQILATLRYAQKASMAQHRLVCVSFDGATPTTISLTIAAAFLDTSCILPLSLPDRAGNSLTASTDITLSPVSFTFDALGRTTARVEITVPGIAMPIIVETETGYVHQ